MKEKRLYQQIAERIKKQITQGTHPPGSRLPGERELAEQFEVSRLTIREAEIALQALGYINIKTGSGAYVLELAEREGQGLPNICAFELTEARLMFESEAAALAARHISDFSTTPCSAAPLSRKHSALLNRLPGSFVSLR